MMHSQSRLITDSSIVTHEYESGIHELSKSISGIINLIVITIDNPCVTAPDQTLVWRVKTHKYEQPTINHTNPVRKTLSWCDPCDVRIKWLHSHCCHSGTSHRGKLLHAVSICILQSCAAVRHMAAQTCKCGSGDVADVSPLYTYKNTLLEMI